MSLNAPNYQFPADAPAVNTDRGTQALAIRRDGGGSPVSADGDYTPLQTNSIGELRVTMLDTVTVIQGTDPWVITGTVALDGPTLAALETITVLQGTSPWVVTGTVALDAATLAALETITVLQGTSPWVVSGTVEVTNDVGNPLPVSFQRLTCATDSVEVCNDVGSPLTVNVNNTITVVPGRRSLRGVYFATSGPLAYTTAADAATGGDLWLVNTSNTVVVYLREVRYTSNIAALALLTALPIIRMERMTFTGPPSGPTITPARRDSLDFAHTGTIRTTNAGMGVITAGAGIKSFAPPSSDIIGGLLAANASSAVPAEQLFVADLDSFIVLRQNEGIVFRQSTAGSVTENRQYQVDIIWEEI